MSRGAAGIVRFVGAGPGDPALLTVRADSLLRSARVVLHDDLVAAEILALIPQEAVVLNVGKRCGSKRITQQEINTLMIGLARRGFDVVRLKSGDPSIFGRLGEEIDALSAAAIVFEVVPGISAGMAAAASLGISLTDRRLSSRVVFATAHHAHDSNEPEAADWRGLARNDSTLVIFMPGRDLSHLQRELFDAGLPGDTPVALVSCASTPAQTERHADLAALASIPAMDAPSILLVGRAVAEKSAARDVDSDSSSVQSGWEEFFELLAPESPAAHGANAQLSERTNL